MKQLLFVAILLVAGVAQAAMTVKQINLDNGRIAVSGARGINVGDSLVYTHDGRQCTLPVVEKVGAFAIANLSDCSLRKSMRVGQNVEKSLLTASTGETDLTSIGYSSRSLAGMNPELYERLRGLSVYASYSFAADADATGDNAQGDSIKQEFQGDRVFGVGAEYEVTDAPAPGFSTMVGATYELERDYEKYRQDGQTGNLDNGGIQLSTWILHGNIGLNLNPRFRGLAGVNYTIPVESGADEQLNGQVGYQFGGSFQVSEKFAVDGLYRFLNYESEDDFEVSLDGLLVRGRLTF